MKALEGELALTPGSLDAYPALLRNMLAGQEFMPLIRSQERSRHRSEWREFLQAIQPSPPSSTALPESFHSSGSRMNEREAGELALRKSYIELERHSGFSH